MNRLGKRLSEWAKCPIAAPREASPCENEAGGTLLGQEYGPGKHLLASAVAAHLFPLDGNSQIATKRLAFPLLLHTHTFTASESAACTRRSVRVRITLYLSTSL